MKRLTNLSNYGLVAVAAFIAIQLDQALHPGARLVNSNTLPAHALAKALAPRVERLGVPAPDIAWLLYQALVLAALAGFGLAWFAQTRRQRITPARSDQALLAVQLVCGVLANDVFPMFTALALGALARERQARAWLAAIVAVSLLLRLVFVLQLDGEAHFSSARRGLFGGLVDAVLQVVAFNIGGLIARERSARASIAHAHAELLSTQQLLGSTARASERLRISRNLHDVVGHHLAALNLHLELATRQQGQPGAAALAVSREIARNLLAEVRAVVAAERGERCIDLPQALATLCDGVPAPRLTLRYQDGVRIESPVVAREVLFIVQEAVTNIIRHANAAGAEVRVGMTPDGLQVEIEDDGRGKTVATRGNGLRGMAERLAELGGSLAEHRGASGGLRLVASIPKERL